MQLSSQPEGLPRMSAHEEQPTEASELLTAELTDEGNREFAPKLIEERIKANLEALCCQVSTLTQMMNQLIQDKWDRINPTAGPRDCRFPSESALIDEPGTSITLL